MCEGYVYPKALRCFYCLALVLLALLLLPSLQAQSPQPATGTASLRGHIADPTGALIPGVKVVLTNVLGVTVTTTVADAQGVYALTSLPPGSYIVQANVDGFAPFSSPTIALAAGQYKRVDISMAVEAEQQSVVVSEDEGPVVTTEAGSNASAMVLKDKDLDALSDDPDELQSELTALAGPSAGPNGGQIYIDGFTGGTLPPKSAIREIRINQNPFSAEFDRIGYGRIEILTKPGTDKFHGRGFMQGNDDAFNTGNPFTKSDQIPAYHSIQYNGSVSGALSKTSSFFLTIEGRNTQDASIYTLSMPQLDSTGHYYIPYDSDGKVIPTSGGLFAPSTRFEISPRFDVQLGARNTLTARFQYERGTSSGSIGSTSTPSTASSSTSSEIALQASDSFIINEHIVNETRIQLRRGISSSTPVSNAPSFSVSGYFSGGGSGGQSSDHSDHIELQNVTTMSAGAHAIKFGGWLRDNREANFSASGFNGSFSFNSTTTASSLTNYVNTLNTCLGITGNCVSNSLAVYQLSYTTGPQKFRANVFDAAAFFQDDWKFNRFLTLSGGVRFESQNHISDHTDFAPRLAFAYALDGHKKNTVTKTVLRGGYGFFYDRFGVGSLLGLERNNVAGLASNNVQKKMVVSSPTCFSSTAVSSSFFASCGSGTSASTPSSQSIDSNYHSPYNEQLGISVERQLSKVATLSATYIHTFGVHQIATRNADAFMPATGSTFYNSTTGKRALDPTGALGLGIVNEIYPEAVFKQNQLIVNVNARLSPKFNVMGYYGLSYGNSNTGTASNSWNLSQDYGRASFVRRNMVFLMGNYTGPWGITFNPMLMTSSGRPYNIVTSNDLTGDNYINNRPSLLADNSKCTPTNSRYIPTSYGCFDVTPGQGEAIIPINLANGPASVSMNLRISRSVGIGPKLQTAGSSGDPSHRQQSYMGGGPGGGPGGGGHGGGGHGGGGRGGPGGGMSNTGRKYSLTFSAQAINVFNDINYATPVGTISPTQDPQSGVWGAGDRFGRSTSLSGGMGASSSSARRIFVMAAFSF
jgi:hypothetical protein